MDWYSDVLNYQTETCHAPFGADKFYMITNADEAEVGSIGFFGYDLFAFQHDKWTLPVNILEEVKNNHYGNRFVEKGNQIPFSLYLEVCPAKNADAMMAWFENSTLIQNGKEYTFPECPDWYGDISLSEEEILRF